MQPDIGRRPCSRRRRLLKSICALRNADSSRSCCCSPCRSSAAADTIVLKNGRRIVAENVTEDADHVTYQTPAGQMSLPKSIVARDRTRRFLLLFRSHAASEPPVSAPQIEPVRGYEDVARLTVHDNAIDFAYLRAWNPTPAPARPLPSTKSPPRIMPPRNFCSARATPMPPSINIARRSSSLRIISACC